MRIQSLLYPFGLWVLFGLTACGEQQLQVVKKNAEPSAQQEQAYILRDAVGQRVVSDAVPVTIDQGHAGLEPSHVRGARIYDDFLIELDQVVPGPNPLLALASSGPVDTITPEDSWRCSQCHGFDYEGGVFMFNNGATNNLLELSEVRGRDEEFVIDLLFNGFDAWDGTSVVNVHNYSALLTPQAMVDVADFVINEIFDTHQYIRVPSNGSLGDHMEGMAIYDSVATDVIPPLIRVDGSNFNCVDCHGADGLLVTGIDLNALSWSDPFQFLHRTLFGSPRSLTTYPGFVNDPAVMPGLYEVVLTDGLHFGGPDQGAAAMAHVQSNLP